MLWRAQIGLIGSVPSMPDVDPRDARAVADAVRGWAADRFASAVEVVGAPTAAGAGFDSYVHFVELAGSGLPAAWRAPLVVRILPSADRSEQARTEAAVQEWAATRGYDAPHVLEVLMPGDLFDRPAQVMQRAPGVLMLDALKARPWRAFALADRLAQLHLALHRIEPTGWPGPGDTAALAAKRLSLPRRAVAQLDDRALAAALERAEALVADGVGSPEVVVCHGDFHPLNVLVDGPRSSVIDWTDAGLAPREADVSRTALLFQVAAVAATGRLERALLARAGPALSRRYRRTYERGAPLDAGLMARWEGLHALHGWAQVEMLHAGAFELESSSAGNEARVPRALGQWLRARFESALSNQGL